MTTPEERDAIEYEEYTDPNAEILALTASRDSLIARNDDLAEALGEAMSTIKALHDAASDAHELLWHYDLTQQQYGVNWGDPAELKQKAIDELWTAIEPARKLLF